MAQVNPRLWKLPGQRTKRKAWGFTAPSWAVQRGASLQEVKDLLGHHSLAMALRYGHLAPEHLRIAVARLDEALPAPTKVSAQRSAQEGLTEGALLTK
jgi:integrase